MIKFQHKKQKAIRFSVSLKGDVQKYALSFLHIWNNAREFPNMFYKVENNASNSVFVTCRASDSDDIKEYLNQFGEIWNVEEINWFTISPEYDTAGWLEFFGDDCESDFTIEID